MTRQLNGFTYYFWLFAGPLHYVLAFATACVLLQGDALLGVLGFDGFMHNPSLWSDGLPRYLGPGTRWVATGVIAIYAILHVCFIRAVRPSAEAGVGPMQGRARAVAGLALSLVGAIVSFAWLAAALEAGGLWLPLITGPGPTIAHWGREFPMPRYWPIGLMLVALWVGWGALILCRPAPIDPWRWARRGALALVVACLPLVLVVADLGASHFIERDQVPAALAGYSAFGTALTFFPAFFRRPKRLGPWRSAAGWILGTTTTILMLFHAVYLAASVTDNPHLASSFHTTLILGWLALLWAWGVLYQLHAPLSEAYRRGQRDPGFCANCDYDLRGTLAAGRHECPECGTAIAEASPSV